MMRSRASLRASSAAASAVASSGYPMAIKSAMTLLSPSARTESGPVHQAPPGPAPPPAGDTSAAGSAGDRLFTLRNAIVFTGPVGTALQGMIRMGQEGHSWPKSVLFITLGGVHGGAQPGAGGRPEQARGAVPAPPRGL